MLLLGVLSAVAFSRFVAPSAYAPSILAQQLRAEIMMAQAQAGNRQDAQVAFELIASAADWRMQTLNDLDGVVRETLIERDNTAIVASSGAASASLDATNSLRVEFDGLGGLTLVRVAGTDGDASTGAQLVVTGDSSRTLCIYPSGYVNVEPCA